jgi:p-cumate 2,3-dioxygenase subunit alpha
MGGASGMVNDDQAGNLFRVSRRAFTDSDVLARERDAIFDHCWLYVGHSSEIPRNGDFVTRAVGGREIIFSRDRTGTVHVFLNTCPHRGAMVAREPQGNASGFRCFYHGWSFHTDGRFASKFPDGNYGDAHHAGGCADLVRAAQIGEYRGFWFLNFDAAAGGLEPYLGDAREILDLVADQGDDGMEIVSGNPNYVIHANWKLLAENSIDGYHAHLTHKTYIDYLGNVGNMRVDETFAAGLTRGVDLGNGHAMVEYPAPWGRPVARWVPSFGSHKKEMLEARAALLIARYGEARGTRMAEWNRNMLIFPNLVVNDIMAITVRTFYPAAPDEMHVSGWALGIVNEDPEMRQLRLFNFLEFLGPGGFATPDDVEALEACQRSYCNQREAGWNDISKGMPRDGQNRHDDEAQMRAFWREWDRRIGAAT